MACKQGRPGAHTRPTSQPAVSRITDRSDRFGVVGRTSGDAATRLLDELAVGWIRVPVNWAQVEPRRGAYNWKEVTAAVQLQARTRPGMHVMVTLRAKSPWAGRRTDGKVREKATVPPQDSGAYYDFIHGMATRGKGAVDCWQIENEMEGSSWWAGTAGEYLALLQTAHRAVRSADPSALIALGGFTSQTYTVAAFAAQGASKSEIGRQLGSSEAARVTPEAESGLRDNVAFVEEVLKGGPDYFDVVDIHLYHRYETIPMRVEWLRSKMREYGYEKPIWATEVGGPDPLVVAYDESVQAQEVVKRAALALASGVERVFWLGLTEMDDQGDRFNRMGLVTLQGRRKPAFRAYELTVRKLSDLQYRESLDLPGGYALVFGNGARTLWVLWADRGARFRFEVGAPYVTLTHLDGREERRAAAGGSLELQLTADPVFVTAAG